MRVTNTMISNSAKNHISNAKNKLLKYGEQYTSQQKIQRPSDDPTVAVRSLKLRTTYSQVPQVGFDRRRFNQYRQDAYYYEGLSCTRKC